MFCAGNLNALLKLHLQFECFVYELCYQGRSQKKKIDWGYVREKLTSEAIGPGLSSLPRY